MELTADQVFKKPIRTVKEFAASCDGVSTSAIYAAMGSGQVDYVILNNHKMVVLTANTRQYKPNNSPLRKSAKTTRRKSVK